MNPAPAGLSLMFPMARLSLKRAASLALVRMLEPSVVATTREFLLLLLGKWPGGEAMGRERELRKRLKYELRLVSKDPAVALENYGEMHFQFWNSS